jgi:hypothetical protein
VKKRRMKGAKEERKSPNFSPFGWVKNEEGKIVRLMIFHTGSQIVFLPNRKENLVENICNGEFYTNRLYCSLE